MKGIDDMNNMFKDFEWRKEEVDKLRLSEYKIVNISIEGSGYGDGGWRSMADMVRFENEVYQKLRDAGYTINNPTMSGASHTLTANDIHTSLYLHPTSFTGYAKPSDIEQITAILNDCSCLNKATVIKAADCYDLTDAEYARLIYAHSKEITDSLTSKTSRYDVGFQFAEQHRIDRVGDKASGVLSSSDVDVKAVEAIYDIAKNLGYFEERAKQQELPKDTQPNKEAVTHIKDDEYIIYNHEDSIALHKNGILVAEADKHTSSVDELYSTIPENATVWDVYDDGSGSLKKDNQIVARYDLATNEINMGDGWDVANCSSFKAVREYVYNKLNISAEKTTQHNITTPTADTKDSFAPLYTHDLSEAKERGELDRAKADYQYNRNCAKAIDRAINNNFADNHFNSDAAFAAAVELSGHERVAHVIAAQIANHDYDGRYSKDTKEWAKDKMSEFSDKFIERSREYYLSAHPVLIDSFANKCIEFDKTMTLETKVAIEDFAKRIEDAAMRTPQYFGILSELKTQLNNIDYIILGNNKDEAIKEFAYTLLRDAEVHDCYHTLKSIVTEQLAQTVDKLRNNETEKWEAYGDENIIENGGLLLRNVYGEAERAKYPQCENAFDFIVITKDNDLYSVHLGSFNLADYMADKSHEAVEAESGADFTKLSKMDNAALILQSEGIDGVPPYATYNKTELSQLKKMLEDLGYSGEPSKPANKEKISIERDD